MQRLCENLLTLKHALLHMVSILKFKTGSFLLSITMIIKNLFSINNWLEIICCFFLFSRTRHNPWLLKHSYTLVTRQLLEAWTVSTYMVNSTLFDLVACLWKTQDCKQECLQKLFFITFCSHVTHQQAKESLSLKSVLWYRKQVISKKI